MLFKKMKRIPAQLSVLLLVIAFAVVMGACPEDEVGGTTTETAAAFQSLTADGSSTAVTTKLTLTFDKDIAGLGAGDITLSAGSTGAVKGALTKASGTGVYDLAVSSLTAGGTVSVSVTKTGYNVSGNPKQVTVFGPGTPVTFQSLTADGSAAAATTKLTLTFDKDITGLAADDIAISAGSTGAVKGALTKASGTGVYDLAVSGLTIGGTVSVTVTKSGYSVTGNPQTAALFGPPGSGNADTPVTFQSLTADGSAAAATTKLTLTFDKNIEGLDADDISLDPGTTGAVKGALTKASGTGVYDLAVSGITKDGQVSVSLAKTGYNVTGNPKTAVVYIITVTFQSLTADGSSTAITTKLTLTFDKDITGLAAGDISLDPASTGTTKGLLTKAAGTGVYDLAVSGITTQGAVSVSVIKAGYAVTGSPKTVTVYPLFETEVNYMSGTDAIIWGISSSAGVLTLGLNPGNNTTEINLNWYSSGTTAGKVAQVRFARGTFTAGKELLTATGTVSTASTGNTAHKATVTGLRPGASYQYAVSGDGTNWSDAYDFKVPAATGAFKFAVIADPQLTTGNIDALSRYPAVGTTTAAGWIETMQKIVAAGVSFIASGGDQVDAGAGSETEYTNFFAPPGLRNLPFAPVSGNHDNHVHFNYHYNVPNTNTEHDGSSATEKGRNYFYLYNNILFVVLDTAPYPGSQSAAGPYITLFDKTLTAAKAAHAGKYDWLIVQHHKSTASVADHLADRDIQYYVEAGFERIMSSHNVDFVLAGHDHVYARSYPLAGRDGGKVSVPDKTKHNTTGADAGHIVTNPGNPIYLTFTTGSGLKYYAVSSDPTSVFANTTYVKDNTMYPYLGEITEGDGSSYFGSAAYMNDKRLPVSNAAYVQPYIPSYCIVEVNGRTIKFSTYAIATKSGQVAGAAQPYSFDAGTPYDWVQVTK